MIVAVTRTMLAHTLTATSARMIGLTLVVTMTLMVVDGLQNEDETWFFFRDVVTSLLRQ